MENKEPLPRRQYLAIPDWIWRQTFDDYSSLEHGLQIDHDNTVYFYEWKDSDVHHVQAQLEECFFGGPLTISVRKEALPALLRTNKDVTCVLNQLADGRPSWSSYDDYQKHLKQQSSKVQKKHGQVKPWR